MTDDDTSPLLGPWFSGMTAMCTVSVAALGTYRHLMALESDECPDPDHEDPDVVVARASGGELVFVDDREGDKDQAIIIENGDAVMELEEAR